MANGDFRLQSTSPNIDKGAFLQGFNDADSPWPYSGSAPDIGAFEYGSGFVIPPSTPTPTPTPTPTSTPAATPTPTPTPTSPPVPGFSSFTQLTPVFAGGGNVTIQARITFAGTGTLLNASFARPSWLNAANFRINESGTAVNTGLDGSNITWIADTSKTSYLLFEVPAPVIGNFAVADSEPGYQKNFTVSADNPFTDVHVSTDVNFSYGGWKLYWFNGAAWTDATSMFNLTVLGGTASFSGLSTSTQQFMLEGSCPDDDNDGFYYISCNIGNDCNDNNAGINPAASDVCGNGIDEDCTIYDAICPAAAESGSGGGGGGGGGGGSGSDVTILSKEEKPLEPEKDVIETLLVETPPVKGDIDIAIEGDDTAENGELYTAFVTLNAIKDVTNVSVFASGIIKTSARFEIEGLEFIDNSTALFYSRRIVTDLETGREEKIRFDIDVPSLLKGGFSLRVVVSDGIVSEISKPVLIDFKPVVLAVNESGVERKFISISVKSFENATTELTITRDGVKIASGTIEGKKEYSAEVEASKPGTYEIKAVMKSPQGDILDEDVRRVVIENMEQANTAVILAAFALVVIALGYFYYHGRRHIRKADELISAALGQTLITLNIASRVKY